jgi:protein SCO1/2
MKYSIILTLFILIFVSCKDEMPIRGSFPSDVSLTDHNGKEFMFSELKGKVLLVSYIYTNCPDICHIINKKMDVFKSQLIKNKIDKDVIFVSISIDPQNDTPDKLKQHINHMKFDTANWYFVTGSIGSVYRLIAQAGIFPVREAQSNKKNDYLDYIISHRDRISLVDKNGNIRKHYKGTTMDYDTIIKDMKSLI